MRIGIDMDGVIYDFKRAFADYANLPLEEATDTWRFYEGWGMTDEEFLVTYAAGVDEGEILWIGVPIEDARNQIERLEDAGHETIIITDRSIGQMPRTATADWLFDWDIRPSELHFSADKTSVPTDMFIEDKLENYDALDAAGVEAYLLNRPWNQVKGGDNRRRVNSLKEYVDTVLGKEKKEQVASITGEVRVTSSTGGQKGSKPQRYDLIPAEPLRKLAELYGKGAEKYEDRNWEKGYDWSLSFAALNRHLWQFWNGENYDTETGAPHLASVVFHAFALLEFMQTHPEFDNRPNSTKTNPLESELQSYLFPMESAA